MITLILATTFLIAQVPVQQSDCPAQILSMWIKGGQGYGYENSHVELKLQNDSAKTIEAVAFQYDRYDQERRVFKSRYYLVVACCDRAGYPGKPIGPGQTKTLWGGVSMRLGVLGGYLADPEGLKRTKINVMYFTDGTKWERPNWRDENPN